MLVLINKIQKLKVLLFGIILCTNVLAQKTYSSEKIYVHTDNNSYIQGDTIWFKTATYDASTHISSTASAVAYVQLLDKNNVAILQEKVFLQNGQGAGQLAVSTKLPDDVYTIVAFTNLMRNADENLFFKKQIRIARTLNSVIKSKKAMGQNEQFEFYPESGQMVNYIDSKVAFRIFSEEILKESFEIKVQNKEGKIVTTFYPDFQGIGIFEIKPEPEQNYFAVFNYKKKPYKIELPKAQELGYVMSTDNVINNEAVIVNIHSNKNEPEKLLLMAQQRGETLFSNAFFATNSLYKFKLNNELIPTSGTVNFMLLDSNNVTVCERLVYVKKTSAMKVNVSKSLKNGQSNLIIGITDDNNKPVISNDLAVSVKSVSSTKNQEPLENGLGNYLNLDADLGEKAAFLDSLNKLESTVGKYTYDNLMLTMKWKRPVSNNVDSFLPEKSLHLKGIAKNENQELLTNQSIRLFLKSKYVYNYIETNTDNTGAFEVKGYWEDSVRIIATDVKNKLVLLSFESTHIPKVLKIDSGSVLKTNNLTPVVSSNASLLKPVVKTAATGTDKKSADLKNDIRRRLYKGEPDFTLAVTDENTKDLQSSFQLIKQNFTPIEITKYLNKFTESDVVNTATAENSILHTYIDGSRVPTEFVSLLKPTDLVQIDLLNSLPKTKSFTADTCVILNVLTKKGKDIYSVFQDNNINKWKGYSTVKKFNYSKFKAKAILPRPTTTTYWNTELRSDKDGKISFSVFNPDITKTQLLTIQGTDQNGNPIYIKTILKN